MNFLSDLHTHTLASTHAYSTIIENCESAASRGIKIIAMTDHSYLMPDGPHPWHTGNQSVLPQILRGVCVLKGVEADIMNPDGELDVAKYTIPSLQWIVASFHTPVYAEIDEETHLKTIENVCKIPEVDIFGHLHTYGHKFDYTEGAKLFAKYDKIVEVNDASLRADRSPMKNAVDLLTACKKEGVKISIDSDAHFCDSIGVVDVALEAVKAVRYPKELIINNDYEYIIRRVNENHKRAENIDIDAVRELING